MTSASSANGTDSVSFARSEVQNSETVKIPKLNKVCFFIEKTALRLVKMKKPECPHCAKKRSTSHSSLSLYNECYHKDVLFATETEPLRKIP